jgi:hypothetical protein
VNARPEDEDAIEAYLDELFAAARDAEPAAARRLLAEAEAHLRESAARLAAQGLGPEDAETEAVRRFGPVAAVTPALRTPLRSVGRLPLHALERPAVGLAALGAIAVGLSGVLSGVFGRLWGAGFVSGDLPGVAYTAARCAVLQAPYPGLDCAQAAAQHHWGEVVEGRVFLGAVGIVLLVLWRILPPDLPLPAGLVPGLGAAAFLLASAATGLAAGSAAVQGGQGVGAWLSATSVALPLGLALGVLAAVRARRQSALRDAAAR